MRRLLSCLLVVCGFAGSARADDVQAARERAKGLLERSAALAANAAAGLRRGQTASEVFSALLRLDVGDGSSVGVFDQDGRRIAWVGTPIDPLLLPEVDPAAPVTLVAATKSRASLVVTAKGPDPWFVLVSTPLLETRRVGVDRAQVVDALDPGRALGLDYSDRSPPVSTAEHANERIVVSGIMFAKVPAHAPAVHTTPSERPVIPAGAIILALLFGAAAIAAFRYARGAFADPRTFLLTLVVVLAAIPVTALISELAARRAERAATLLEIRSIIRAHRTPLELTLRATEAEIDKAALFETSPAGRFGTEELAFDLWSDSPLAQPLLPSFVEVMDRSGAVVSRYGRDIQRGPKPGLPASGSWVTSAISLPEGDVSSGALNTYVRSSTGTASLPFSEGPSARVSRVGSSTRAPRASRTSRNAMPFDSARERNARFRSLTTPTRTPPSSSPEDRRSRSESRPSPSGRLMADVTHEPEAGRPGLGPR